VELYCSQIVSLIRPSGRAHFEGHALMHKDSTLQDKIEHPANHYDTPDDLVRDKALSHEDKKAALSTWEQDARQLLTASNEGMPANGEGIARADHNQLGQVERALERLGEKPEHKPAQ
jgi:hypothetical protein